MGVRCLNSKSVVVRVAVQCDYGDSGCERACAQCRALLGCLPWSEVGRAHVHQNFARVQRL